PIETPKLQLNWDESTGADQYNLYVSSDLISTIEGLTPQYTGPDPIYKFELKDYGTYYVAVSAINQYGASPLSNCEGVTYGNISPPIAPLLRAQIGEDGKRVTLSWNDVAGAQKYHLYKALNVIRTKPPSGSEIYAGKETTSED